MIFLVRTGTAAMLEDLGHAVIEAESGQEALQILAASLAVDLVLTDFAMPGMNGIELIRQINEKYPHMNVLFVSGYAESSRADINPGCIRLAKPFNQDQLAAAISQTLAIASRPIVA